MRRTCAKLCRDSGKDLEQIQFLLGHASIQTTERYLGAIGTPNAVVWNIMGFIVPRICLAVVGRAIAETIDTKQGRSGRVAAWLLPLFGLGAASQGLFPAL